MPLSGGMTGMTVIGTIDDKYDRRFYLCTMGPNPSVVSSWPQAVRYLYELLRRMDGESDTHDTRFVERNDILRRTVSGRWMLRHGSTDLPQDGAYRTACALNRLLDEVREMIRAYPRTPERHEIIRKIAGRRFAMVENLESHYHICWAGDQICDIRPSVVLQLD